jgi:hypothetical protein
MASGATITGTRGQEAAKYIFLTKIDFMRSKKRTLISNCDLKLVIFVGAAVVIDRPGRQKINSLYATGSKYNHELETIYRS